MENIKKNLLLTPLENEYSDRIIEIQNSLLLQKKGEGQVNQYTVLLQYQELIEDLDNDANSTLLFYTFTFYRNVLFLAALMFSLILMLILVVFISEDLSKR